MIVKIDRRIWYGDKPSVVESLGRVGSIINVAHVLRRPYWRDLKKLDWTVWYFRLALPDRVEADDAYCRAFENIISSIEQADKFPILCHCRVGGHRGPTAAFFAYWCLNGKTQAAFQAGLVAMEQKLPGFSKPHSRRIYRQTVLAYCKRNSR